MWRFYFRFEKPDLTKMSEPNRLNWEACDRAARIFTEPEIELLRRYYMTGYGKYEDLQAISDFSEQNRIKHSEIWDIIKRANYEVIVERGLMDRKEVDQGGSA